MAPTSVTGTVAFYDGNTYLGSGTLASGVYSLTLGSTTAGYGILQAGTHNFSATYGGSTTYSTATGTLTSTIAQSTTALTLSAPANSTYGPDRRLLCLPDADPHNRNHYPSHRAHRPGQLLLRWHSRCLWPAYL